MQHFLDQRKIIDSKAFRRLMDKTQVIFSVERNAQVRSRLTHSLEVASISREIAMNNPFIHKYEINPECCFNTGLIHDYGMCSLGHMGENTVNDIFSLHTNLVFEANANNLVVIEKNIPNISLLTIVSTIKYPYLFKSDDKKQKKGIYEPQYNHYIPILNEIIEQQNQYPDIKRNRTYECDIMEIADDIAYLTSDLEDAITSYNVSLTREDLKNYFKKHNLVNPDLFNKMFLVLTKKDINTLIEIREAFIKNIYFNVQLNTFTGKDKDLLKLQDIIRDIDFDLYIKKYSVLSSSPIILDYRKYLTVIIEMVNTNPTFVAEEIIISKTYRKQFLEAINQNNIKKAYKILLITIAEWTDTTLFNKINIAKQNKLI